MPSKNEERELLQLQCELARLKIATSYRKQRQANQQNQQLTHWVNALTSLSPTAWQLALLPKQKKYRLLLVGAMLLAQMVSRGQVHSRKMPRP